MNLVSARSSVVLPEPGAPEIRIGTAARTARESIEPASSLSTPCSTSRSKPMLVAWCRRSAAMNSPERVVRCRSAMRIP